MSFDDGVGASVISAAPLGSCSTHRTMDHMRSSTEPLREEEAVDESRIMDATAGNKRAVTSNSTQETSREENNSLEASISALRSYYQQQSSCSSSSSTPASRRNGGGAGPAGAPRYFLRQYHSEEEEVVSLEEKQDKIYANPFLPPAEQQISPSARPLYSCTGIIDGNEADASIKVADGFEDTESRRKPDFYISQGRDHVLARATTETAAAGGTGEVTDTAAGKLENKTERHLPDEEVARIPDAIALDQSIVLPAPGSEGQVDVQLDQPTTNSQSSLGAIADGTAAAAAPGKIEAAGSATGSERAAPSIASAPPAPGNFSGTNGIEKGTNVTHADDYQQKEVEDQSPAPVACGTTRRDGEQNALYSRLVGTAEGLKNPIAFPSPSREEILSAESVGKELEQLNLSVDSDGGGKLYAAASLLKAVAEKDKQKKQDLLTYYTDRCARLEQQLEEQALQSGAFAKSVYDEFAQERLVYEKRIADLTEAHDLRAKEVAEGRKQYERQEQDLHRLESQCKRQLQDLQKLQQQLALAKQQHQAERTGDESGLTTAGSGNVEPASFVPPPAASSSKELQQAEQLGKPRSTAAACSTIASDLPAFAPPTRTRQDPVGSTNATIERVAQVATSSAVPNNQCEPANSSSVRDICKEVEQLCDQVSFRPPALVPVVEQSTIAPEYRIVPLEELVPPKGKTPSSSSSTGGKGDRRGVTEQNFSTSEQHGPAGLIPPDGGAHNCSGQVQCAEQPDEIHEPELSQLERSFQKHKERLRRKQVQLGSSFAGGGGGLSETANSSSASTAASTTSMGNKDIKASAISSSSHTNSSKRKSSPLAVKYPRGNRVKTAPAERQGQGRAVLVPKVGAATRTTGAGSSVGGGSSSSTAGRDVRIAGRKSSTDIKTIAGAAPAEIRTTGRGPKPDAAPAHSSTLTGKNLKNQVQEQSQGPTSGCLANQGGHGRGATNNPIAVTTSSESKADDGGAVVLAAAPRATTSTTTHNFQDTERVARTQLESSSAAGPPRTPPASDGHQAPSSKLKIVDTMVVQQEEHVPNGAEQDELATPRATNAEQKRLQQTSIDPDTTAVSSASQLHQSNAGFYRPLAPSPNEKSPIPRHDNGNQRPQAGAAGANKSTSNTATSCGPSKATTVATCGGDDGGSCGATLLSSVASKELAQGGPCDASNVTIDSKKDGLRHLLPGSGAGIALDDSALTREEAAGREGASATSSPSSLHHPGFAPPNLAASPLGGSRHYSTATDLAVGAGEQEALSQVEPSTIAASSPPVQRLIIDDTSQQNLYPRPQIILRKYCNNAEKIMWRLENASLKIREHGKGVCLLSPTFYYEPSASMKIKVELEFFPNGTVFNAATEDDQRSHGLEGQKTIPTTTHEAAGQEHLQLPAEQKTRPRADSGSSTASMIADYRERNRKVLDQVPSLKQLPIHNYSGGGVGVAAGKKRLGQNNSTTPKSSTSAASCASGATPHSVKGTNKPHTITVVRKRAKQDQVRTVTNCALSVRFSVLTNRFTPKRFVAFVGQKQSEVQNVRKKVFQTLLEFDRTGQVSNDDCLDVGINVLPDTGTVVD
ncbi:unnamed protein product [Amoebophrya sp. A120]|nr:unnamed protein product [Amoebophrya sp. A120]|eukprot:GSA120T00025392001.1